MVATLTQPTNPLTQRGPQELLSAIAHLREAATDLYTALELGNVPNLYAMQAEWLQDCYRDLDALVAQLDAMRVQFAEYVEVASEA